MTYKDLWLLFGDMIPEVLLKDIKPAGWNPDNEQ